MSIGHLSVSRDTGDYYALSIMDEILGAGSLASRFYSRICSREGLDAGTRFGFGVYYAGVFRAYFQSKSSSCAEATSIALEEISRIRNEKVTGEELEQAVDHAIEDFPRYFASAATTVERFADDEYTHRKPGFWQSYCERMRAVKREDIQRVAEKYLRPDKLITLAVGDVEAMMRGNPDKPLYSFQKLAKGKPINLIPLPDPVTMTYPKLTVSKSRSPEKP